MINPAGPFILLAAAALMAGCATQSLSWTHYRAPAKEWVGKRVGTLIQSWGPPTEPIVGKPSGARVYTWFQWWVTVSDDESRHAGFSDYQAWTRSSGAAGTAFCKTVVRTNPEAVIKSVKQEGTCEGR